MGTEAPRSYSGGMVELVAAGDGLVSLNTQLLMGARHEILGFSLPPLSPYDEAFIEFKLAILGRGVRGRVIYDPESLETPGILRFIEATRPAGEEPRMAAELPMPLLIVDRRVAFVPAHSDKRGIAHDYLVVHPCSLLDALVVTFESAWERAAPFEPGGNSTGAPTTTDKLGFSADENRVLALLGAGMQDASIALQLGLTPRTVQRHVRHVIQVLGTRTRFQTGLEAGRRGLLGHEPQPSAQLPAKVD